jgi:hypothetical protein
MAALFFFSLRHSAMMIGGHFFLRFLALRRLVRHAFKALRRYSALLVFMLHPFASIRPQRNDAGSVVVIKPLRSKQTEKARNCDGYHGDACPELANSAQLKKGDAMKKIAVIWALAIATTAGMALTTAFAFGLMPLGSIY